MRQELYKEGHCFDKKIYESGPCIFGGLGPALLKQFTRTKCRYGVSYLSPRRTNLKATSTYLNKIEDLRTKPVGLR